MGTYTATVRWERRDQAFLDDAYSRGHVWEFDGGLSVPASASPQVVPPPRSVAENADPEEALVAAVSSCHMLFFLSLASKQGFVVDRYTDAATGHMAQDDRGRISMTRIVLRPAAAYSGDRIPDRQQLERLHHRSHELCFIANSLRSEIVTEIVS